MSQQLRFKRRSPRRNPMSTRRVGRAFDARRRGAATALEYPGIVLREPERSRRTWFTAGFALALHAGVIGALFLVAALAPEVIEEVIPVQLLHDEPPQPPPEPAAAPKVLAERRLPNFSPQVQTVAPQIVNPRVIAQAAPTVRAEALDMDAVGSVVAPREISRSAAPVVERVGVVNSPIAARASAVDVPSVGGPAVRGPIHIDAPAGPSVGPRQVQVATGAPSLGTGKLQIGSGSSVREGKITGRDVVGSPTGTPLVSIDTAVGAGMLRGSGGSGSAATTQTVSECMSRAEVRTYLDEVRSRTLDRWILPPGVDAGQNVTLRFELDVGGSATTVSLVKASDNALGASAVDALRAAAPFPPMADRVRCLSRVPIIATFTNPVSG